MSDTKLRFHPFFQTLMSVTLNNMIVMRMRNALILNQDINVSVNLAIRNTMMEENAKVQFSLVV